MALHRFTRLALALTATAAATVPASAQGGDGYLFHRPDARISVRLGYDHANANSDLFKQVTQDLTLNKRDFSGFTAGAELAIPVSSRFEISVDAGFSHSGKDSEFRHFIDNNDRPIQQNTLFQRVPVTGNIRLYLSPPGRQIGQLAWIPARVTPWVSGGVGTMWYRFRQQGDFVDFNTRNVYASFYESSAWSQMVQASGGVDVSLNPFMALRSSIQSVWAKGPLGRDFSGFDKIDLSGVNATVGLSFRL